MIPTGNFKIFLLSEPKKDGSNTTCIVGIPPSRKKAAPLQLQLIAYSKLMQETLNNAQKGDAFFLSNTTVRHDPTGETVSPEGKKYAVYSYSFHGGLLVSVPRELEAFPNINQIHLFGWCGFDPTEKDLVEITPNLLKARQSVSVLMGKDDFNSHTIEQLSNVDDVYNAAVQLNKWAKKRKEICVKGTLTTTTFRPKNSDTDITKTVIEVKDFQLGTEKNKRTQSNNDTFHQEESIGDAWAEPKAKTRSVTPIGDALGGLPGQWDSSPQVPSNTGKSEIPF